MKYLIILLLLFHLTFGRYVPVLINLPNSKNARQDLIGGWIQSSEWFPIEINIPDAIGAVSNGLQTGFLNFTEAFGNWIQGLPFFNRFTNTPYIPRPHEESKTKLLVLVPIKGKQGHDEDSLLPFYP